jgi:hypothetical protein
LETVFLGVVFLELVVRPDLAAEDLAAVFFVVFFALRLPARAVDLGDFLAADFFAAVFLVAPDRPLDRADVFFFVALFLAAVFLVEAFFRDVLEDPFAPRAVFLAGVMGRGR